jgi:hypothetical protein
MGVVIEFPTERSASRARAARSPERDCTVVILPVIRIDRYDDEPAWPESGGETGGKRRRRASRS